MEHGLSTIMEQPIVDNAALPTQWARIRSRLQTEVGELEYRNWLRQMTFAGVDGDEITVLLPTRFLCDWVRSRYGDRLNWLWHEENPAIRRVDIRVGGGAATSVALAESLATTAETPPVIAKPEERMDQHPDLTIDPRFTFDAFVVGKPNELFAKFKPEPGFHFLPVEFGSKFEDYYIPSELTAKDYPNLIPEGEVVQTISVAALLAVYNWRPETDRYRRCVRFVEYLFERFDKLRGPTFQPDWKEMNLAGTIPGWTRFPPAQEMVNRAAAAKVKVDPAIARQQAARAAPGNAAEQERLFQQFLEWSKQQKRQ